MSLGGFIATGMIGGFGGALKEQGLQAEREAAQRQRDELLARFAAESDARRAQMDIDKENRAVDRQKADRKEVSDILSAKTQTPNPEGEELGMISREMNREEQIKALRAKGRFKEASDLSLENYRDETIRNKDDAIQSREEIAMKRLGLMTDENGNVRSKDPKIHAQLQRFNAEAKEYSDRSKILFREINVNENISPSKKEELRKQMAELDAKAKEVRNRQDAFLTTILERYGITQPGAKSDESKSDNQTKPSEKPKFSDPAKAALAVVGGEGPNKSSGMIRKGADAQIVPPSALVPPAQAAARAKTTRDANELLNR